MSSDSHSKGLDNLEKKLSHLTNTERELFYGKSDVDYLGVYDRTLHVYEYKSKAKKQKAYYQLKTHVRHFVPAFIEQNPELDINRVKGFYASPKGIELKIDYKI